MANTELLIRQRFTREELQCRCGCGAMPPQESIERLTALRYVLNMPLNINSAARCLRHNGNIGGATNSPHIVPSTARPGEQKTWGGCGFDIRITSLSHAIRIAIAAKEVGFRGIAISMKNSFIHVDDMARPQTTYWDY
jgi:hypothetical protein